ncbi:hypothetical protein GBA63_13630 [Rubrobacter tropicus]|uniref:Uncharacterized protein n=1 Tax=Rubrobacter tropicus TaxID=2653851 RepID=A0A6G8QAR8_9ACTN|nr:hypothetical protein [Rubrobacter tropicus]QIN83561.1 hypothetical protein GBA63_13630 [Rubrobacter tropicus]
MRSIVERTGRMSYAAATALAVVLLSVLMAGPAWANHTQTCEFVDGVRVCIPDEHTPPAVNANNGSVVVNEGQTASNTGTFSDPDGNATVTLSASVGTVTKDDANGTWSWTFRTSDGPDESRTVTITASDGTDSVDTTFSLGVNNVAPAVTLQNGFPSVQEGGSFALGYASHGYNLSVSDPGNDTWTLNTGCGTNGSEWQESSFTVWCGFFDGPATGSVSATATDSDGASRTATVNVTITNRDPVAVLDAPASINEGGTATISLAKGNFNTQDGQADTTAGFHYAFDCNGGPLDGATYASSGTAASTNCTFDDNGARSVRARIIDKDGGFTEYTRTITVNNVAPTAAFEAPAEVDQGGNFQISLSNVADPSGADGAALSYAFDCGDGPGFVSSGAPSKTCTALDQPNMTVRGRVTDKDGGTNEYARTVSVNNVAPTGTVRINGDAAATNNATVRLDLSATDPLPGSGVGHMRFRNENTETWSAWEPYSTGRSWLLSGGDGTKTVHVQYRDNAGNVSTAAIEDGILLDSQLDTNAPDTTITSGPTGVVNLPSASFGLASSETGSTFECRLDGGAFAACSSPKGYTGLSNGPHTFSVRAKDVAGNADTTPAVRTWTVDTIKPTISGMSPGHGSVIRDTTPTIRATVKDNRPLSTGNIKLYVAGKAIPPAKFRYAASTGLLVYNSPSLAKGKKTVKIVAMDGARNAGTKSWYFTIR